MSRPTCNCAMNCEKNRKASWFTSRLAVTNALRSGSFTPSVAFSIAERIPGLPTASASSFHNDAFPGSATSQIFPVAIPCARKPSFSDKVKRVGSFPSMKRPAIFSNNAAAGFCEFCARRWPTNSKITL